MLKKLFKNEIVYFLRLVKTCLPDKQAATDAIRNCRSPHWPIFLILMK